MRREIVVVGSLNMDWSIYVAHIPMAGETVLGERLTMSPGGKGGNQAFAAARLGGQAAMVGKVGNDSIGNQLRQGLSAVGVDTNCVTTEVSGVATGAAVICIDSAGNNAIAVAPGANHCLVPEDIDKADHLFTAGKLLLIQLEIPIATVLHTLTKAKARGMTTILDPAPAVPLAPETLERVDILTPNESEARILLGELPNPLSIPQAEQAANALRRYGANVVILKLGDKGAWFSGPRVEGQHYAAYRVNAVDATAAGDVFDGALAVALAEGSSEDDAIKFANAAAGLSTSRRGAQVSIPDRTEVSEFQAQQRSTL
jgi:ribokinase